jgi:hypothetical protein
MKTGAFKLGRLAAGLATVASCIMAIPAMALDLFRYECSSSSERPVSAAFVSTGGKMQLIMSEGPGEGFGTAGGFIQNPPEITQFSFEILPTGEDDTLNYPHLLIQRTDAGTRIFGLPHLEIEGLKKTRLTDGYIRIENERPLKMKNVVNFGIYVSGRGKVNHSAFLRNFMINDEPVGMDTSTFIPCDSIRGI